MVADAKAPAGREAGAGPSHVPATFTRTKRESFPLNAGMNTSLPFSSTRWPQTPFTWAILRMVTARARWIAHCPTPRGSAGTSLHRYMRSARQLAEPFRVHSLVPSPSHELGLEINQSSMNTWFYYSITIFSGLDECQKQNQFINNWKDDKLWCQERVNHLLTLHLLTCVWHVNHCGFILNLSPLFRPKCFNMSVCYILDETKPDPPVPARYTSTNNSKLQTNLQTQDEGSVKMTCNKSNSCY